MTVQCNSSLCGRLMSMFKRGLGEKNKYIRDNIGDDAHMVAKYQSVGLWKLWWASQMHVNLSWKKYQSFEDCKNQIFQQQIFATRVMGFSNSFNKASSGSKQRGCERKTNWASGTLILFCRIPTESLSWECSTLVRDDVQPDGELTPAWQCPGRHEGWCL